MITRCSISSSKLYNKKYIVKIQSKRIFGVMFNNLIDNLLNYLTYNNKNAVNSKFAPSFNMFTDSDIFNLTNINPNHTYKNNLYWAPKFYVHKDISFELLDKIKIFNRLKEWKDHDNLSLAQLLITEAIRDTTYDVLYNYECKSNKHNILHGNIPMLLYNKDPESL